VGEITDALRRAREEAKRLAEADGPDALVSEPELPETSPEPIAPVPSETPLPPPVASRARDFAPLPARRSSDIHLPHSKDGPWVARTVIADHHGPFTAHYRHFALRLSSELKERDEHIALITSAVGQDGKTTTACNVALAFASMAVARRVAIVEFDLRRPTLAKALGFDLPEVGLEQVLLGDAPLAAACLHSDDGIDIYPVVNACGNAHEVLVRADLGALMRNLEQSYDVVILDTPPVLAVPDVSLILPYVNVCVTVARAGQTPLSAYRSMLELLPREKVVGAFLNGVARSRDFQQYDYHTDSGARGKSR
jgi:Mrp family chromosome partitioning ATPase